MSFWSKLSGAKESARSGVVEKEPVKRAAKPIPVIRALPTPPANAADLREGFVLSLIFEAARSGGLEQVKALFDGNPHLVLHKDSYRGATPLHVAAEKGKKDVAEFLLEKGSDVNARNKVGNTPLHIAATKGRKDIARLLLAKRADVNAKNRYGSTPLHLAAGKGNGDVVALLLAKKADANARDNDGTTPLHCVARETSLGKFDLHKYASELLLANKADVNAMDNAHQTPIHLAAGRGSYDMVRFLIENGANVNASAFGRTPLNFVTQDGGNRAVEDLLRQHGGRMLAKDNELR